MLERTRYTDGLARDLSAHDVRDHGARSAGLSARIIPIVVEAEQQFFNLMVDDERGFYFQPCFSVVWDTAIAAYALGESAWRRITRWRAARIGC